MHLTQTRDTAGLHTGACSRRDLSDLSCCFCAPYLRRGCPARGNPRGAEKRATDLGASNGELRDTREPMPGLTASPLGYSGMAGAAGSIP